VAAASRAFEGRQSSHGEGPSVAARAVGGIGSGCSRRDRCAGGQRGGDGDVVTRLLQPSAAVQRVEVAGGVTVVVPGGLLDEPTTLVVTKTPRLPSLAGGLLQSMPGYLIRLGDQTTFDQELTLEFALDDARLAAGQELLFVSFYDNELVGEKGAASVGH